MDNSTRILLMLLIVGVAFLIVSAIFMAVYNYTIPKLVMSINNNYKSTDFSPIDFETACMLVILYILLFGFSSVLCKNCMSKRLF
jgi:hypothetical protein